MANPQHVAQDVFESAYAGQIPDKTPTIEQLQARHGISQHAARALRKLLVHGAPAARPDTAPDAAPGEGPSNNGKYEYDFVRNLYIFSWTETSGPRRIALAGEAFDKIVKAYTEDGDGQTMQVVATSFGLSRRDFHRIKSIYGLTKAHEPFTLEALAERDEDDLVTDHLALKRRRLMKRVEIEDFARTKDAARKWYTLEKGVLNPFEEILKTVVGHTPAAREPRAVPSTPEGLVVVYQGSDLHLGLRVDGEYDRREARLRWLAGLDLAREGAESSQIDAFVLLVGGDIAHTDTYGGTTTRGTPLDVDGDPETVLRDVVDMYLTGVDDLLSRGLRVHMECVPGNHDEMLSRAAILALWAAYRNNPLVSFGNMHEPYAHVVFGDVALLLHHGHGKADAPGLAAILDGRLRKAGQAAKHRYAITGNLHHLAAKEDAGIVLLQQPSPAPADRWHGLKGFGELSRPATVAFYFSLDGMRGMKYLGF